MVRVQYPILFFFNDNWVRVLAPLLELKEPLTDNVEPVFVFNSFWTA